MDTQMSISPVVAPGHHRRTMSSLRRTVTVTSVLLLVLALANPAAAGDILHFTGDVAVAQWSLGSTHSFFVAAFDGRVQSPPGRPAVSEQVLVGGHEEFCWEEEDVLVIRDFFGWDTPDALTIDRQLMTASVADPGVSVYLEEVYYPSCANPDFENPSFSSYEGSVALSASWTGSGPLVRTRTSYSLDAGPDCKISFRSHGASRAASATASLSGASEIDLTTSDLAYAEILATRDTGIQIGNGCY